MTWRARQGPRLGGRMVKRMRTASDVREVLQSSSLSPRSSEAEADLAWGHLRSLEAGDLTWRTSC